MFLTKRNGVNSNRKLEIGNRKVHEKLEENLPEMLVARDKYSVRGFL